MKRRTLMTATAGIGFFWPALARAQPPGARLVGFIGSGSATIYAARIDALKSTLREFRYIEGQNVTFEARFADGAYDRLPQLSQELVALRPDIIVAAATPAIQAAQRATSIVPIVMSPATDPVGSGFVKSLAHPGGNITGVANMSPDLSAKSLQILHSIAPGRARVGVLMSNNTSHIIQLDAIGRIAAQLRVHIIQIKVNSPAELSNLPRLLVESNCDCVLVFNDPLMISSASRIAQCVFDAKLPAVYQAKEHVQAGGLASYGADLLALARQAATYVGRILRGARPADLPVEQPTKFELVINMAAVRALGLEIPPTLLAVADQIID